MKFFWPSKITSFLNKKFNYEIFFNFEIFLDFEIFFNFVIFNFEMLTKKIFLNEKFLWLFASWSSHSTIDYVNSLHQGQVNGKEISLWFTFKVMVMSPFTKVN